LLQEALCGHLDIMDKIKNKKSVVIGLFLVISIFLISLNVSAVGEVSLCCEKTVSGAWCQNAPAEECAGDTYRSVPTSCEATSYCKLGTCINSQEGTCLENTPQRVCEENGGMWSAEKEENIPQCQAGCCLIGDQAAFVSQTRCKRLSSLYGLESNYRTDISNEIQCIASAYPDVKGACVFEKEFEKTCNFLTKKECQNLEANSGETGNVEFYSGFLCSAEELGTNCGRPSSKASIKTTCVEGRDEVFFLDTCGNLANIYDESRWNDPLYWKETYGKAESCGYGISNAGSSNCGNCDYYEGSTCSEDKICRDLNCEYDDVKYKHGETWCADAQGVSQIDISRDSNGDYATSSLGDNLPGGRHFRLVCYNGEVTVEPCADYRQEICIEGNVDSTGEIFRTSACRANMWQDCIAQDTEKNCENSEKRDCKWIDDVLINSVYEFVDKDKENGTCLPKYSPGYNFWQEGDAESLCSLASQTCTITYEAGFFDRNDVEDVDKMTLAEKKEYCIKDKDDENNCACLEGGSWKDERKEMCLDLGDCGIKTNYLEQSGFNIWDDLFKSTGEGDEDD